MINLRREPDTSGGIFDINNKKQEIAVLEEKMGAESFWNDQRAAQVVISKANILKAVVNGMEAFKAKLDDARAMEELLNEEGVDEVSEEAEELQAAAFALKEELNELEIKCYLNKPHDRCNALLTINASAGGTESCDWADLLFRMYSRWAEREGAASELRRWFWRQIRTVQKLPVAIRSPKDKKAIACTTSRAADLWPEPACRSGSISSPDFSPDNASNNLIRLARATAQVFP